MYFFIAILTVGFIYELSLGAIDLKMCFLQRLDRKMLFFYLFIFSILRSYIYGFLIKERGLVIYTTGVKLLHLLIVMKKNQVISLNLLMDIVVVDLITSKLNGRFVLNYVF